MTRSVLRVWLASRVAVVVTSFAAAWLILDSSGATPSWLAGWDHWDVGLFRKVAEFGYQGFPRHYPDRGIVAFFPGLPLVLRGVHLVLRNWTASGLVISAVAGAVATVALARVARLDDDEPTSVRAVAYLVLSPYAVFLFAGYSEALFLAAALPAWLAARRHRWALAGTTAALAAAVRVTGLFLAAALVVQWAVEPGRRRRWRDLVPLSAPFAVLAGYAAYLHAITGDWFAWQHAQERYWGRTLTAPWSALATTWHASTAPGVGAAYAWSFRAEILAVAVGVALTVLLLATRRWAEAVYVGGQLVALATSSYYLSVGRTALLWWPLWTLLARAGADRRVHLAYLSLAGPLSLVEVVAFVQGHWVG